MKVFHVEFAVNDFQALTASDDDVWSTGILDFNSQEKAPTWQPPQMHFSNPRRPAPDLWMPGTSAAIAALPDAFAKVQTQFEMAGEILELPVEGKTFLLLNVLECLNVLDHDKTRWLTAPDGERIVPLDQKGGYAFHADRFDKSSLFKIPELNGAAIFCFEQEADPEEEFKAAVEHHNLKGLRFREVWPGWDAKKLW